MVLALHEHCGCSCYYLLLLDPSHHLSLCACPLLVLCHSCSCPHYYDGDYDDAYPQASPHGMANALVAEGKRIPDRLQHLLLSRAHFP